MQALQKGEVAKKKSHTYYFILLYSIQDNNILVMCMHIHDNLATRKKFSTWVQRWPNAKYISVQKMAGITLTSTSACMVDVRLLRCR